MLYDIKIYEIIWYIHLRLGGLCLLYAFSGASNSMLPEESQKDAARRAKALLILALKASFSGGGRSLGRVEDEEKSRGGAWHQARRGPRGRETREVDFIGCPGDLEVEALCKGRKGFKCLRCTSFRCLLVSYSYV